jgi:hypothetical protein
MAGRGPRLGRPLLGDRPWAGRRRPGLGGTGQGRLKRDRHGGRGAAGTARWGRARRPASRDRSRLSPRALRSATRPWPVGAPCFLAVQAPLYLHALHDGGRRTGSGQQAAHTSQRLRRPRSARASCSAWRSWPSASAGGPPGAARRGRARSWPSGVDRRRQLAASLPRNFRDVCLSRQGAPRASLNLPAGAANTAVRSWRYPPRACGRHPPPISEAFFPDVKITFIQPDGADATVEAEPV